MANRRKIVVASNNKHKIREISQILDGFNVKPASSVVDRFYVEEDGDSFCENAYLKAKALSAYTNEIVLADDSGLEVLALGGEPGVFSARYSREGTDEVNVRKLLDKLKGLSDRRARFVCCVVAIVGGEVLQREGYVYGTIIDSPRGSSGFGYDPIFVPDGFSQTFAEMDPDLKNSISHRRRALEGIKEVLEELL